ncbi:cation efflux protein [Chytriomyces sp. MP71]|nr:cation efflux protein [Chytriomyces sp. MP71]
MVAATEAGEEHEHGDRESTLCVEDGVIAAVDKSVIAASLRAALVLCTVFFIVELVGGWLCGSLAILSDAFHLLSDVAGFGVSLAALKLAQKVPTGDYPFGFQRVEVLGACASTLSIWAITIFLLIEAISRLMNPCEIDATIMFYTAAFGVVVNIALAFTLHSAGHAHGHSCSQSHANADSNTSHGCSYSDHTHHDYHESATHETHNHSHSHGHNHAHNNAHDDAQNERYHHPRESTPLLPASPIPKRNSYLWFLNTDAIDINARAAALHVFTDLISSIGVLLASLVLLARPDWAWVDPLCTLLFSVLVFASTRGIMQDCVAVLMEGTPTQVDTRALTQELSRLPYLGYVESVRVWSVSHESYAAVAHLILKPGSTKLSHTETLRDASFVIREKYGITHVTVEVRFEEV